VTIAFANGVPTETGPLGAVLGKLRASGAVV